jgi:hypothetical protein
MAIHSKFSSLYRLPEMWTYPIMIWIILLYSFLSQHNKVENSLTFTMYNELMVSMVLLHVSAYEAIIRQYTLTSIHKPMNCVLYEFIYYNITIVNESDFLHS